MPKRTSHAVSFFTARTRSALQKIEQVWSPMLVVRFEGHDFLSEEMAARPSWRQAQVTGGLKGFRKLSVKWRPSFGIAMEADGTIASPWSGLHFLVLSGARVCLPVGYGSDGRLSLSRLLPGKPPSIWKEKGCPPGSL